MKFAGYIVVPLFILTYVVSNIRCELVTLGIIGGALSGLGYYVYEKYKCTYQECCMDEYIHPDLESKYEHIILYRRELFIFDY